MCVLERVPHDVLPVAVDDEEEPAFLRHLLHDVLRAKDGLQVEPLGLHLEPLVDRLLDPHQTLLPLLVGADGKQGFRGCTQQWWDRHSRFDRTGRYTHGRGKTTTDYITACQIRYIHYNLIIIFLLLNIIIIIIVCSMWNSLPKSVRTTETLAAFRKQLKTHLFRLHYLP